MINRILENASKQWGLAVLGLCIAFSAHTVARATHLPGVPHTFTAGTTIVASEVNENFDHLQEQFDHMKMPAVDTLPESSVTQGGGLAYHPGSAAPYYYEGPVPNPLGAGQWYKIRTEKDNVPWNQISDKPTILDSDPPGEIGGVPLVQTLLTNLQSLVTTLESQVSDIEVDVNDLDARVDELSSVINTGTVIASGGVQVGVVTEAASSSNAGMLRYSGGTIQYSNGTAWVNL